MRNDHIQPHPQDTNKSEGGVACIQEINSQVEALHRQGKYREALALARVAARQARRTLDKSHPEYVASLLNLATQYDVLGQYSEAERIYHTVLAIQRRTLGDKHLGYADSLNKIAGLYHDMGRYEDATSLVQQALDIQRQLVGVTHQAYSESLNNLAALYKQMGRYREALPLYEQALEIQQQKPCEDGRLYTACLNNLGVLYIAMGRYEDADPLFRRALDLRRRTHGEAHPHYAQSLHNLGFLCYAKARYEDAEAFYKEALEVWQQMQGDSLPDYAQCLNSLAALYQQLGRYREAETLFKKALQVRQRAQGKAHPDYAQSLGYLATLYQQLGRYREAETLFKKALQVRQRAQGKAHPDYAQSLNHLAGHYYVTKRYDDAEILLQQALDIQRQVLGEVHLEHVDVLNNLALLYRQTERYTEAELLYRKALEIRQRFGSEHNHYAGILFNLADLLVAARHYDEALQRMREGIQIETRVLRRVAIAGTESQVLAFTATMDAHYDYFLTLVYRHLRTEVSAVTAAFDFVLARKALALDVTTSQRMLARASIDQEVRDLDVALRQAYQEWAHRTLSFSRQSSQAVLQEHREALDALQRQCEELEGALAKCLPAMRLQHPLEIDRNALAFSLPPGSLLVEFVRFFPRRYEATWDEPPWDPPHYLAFTLRAGQPDSVDMLDLGEAEAVDSLIATFLAQVNPQARCSGGERDDSTALPLQKTSQKLFRKLFAPLKASLGETEATHLFISPDGELCLLPFEALLRDDGHFLVETQRLSYVTSGRDVLHFGQRTEGAGSVLVVAHPDYDYCLEGQPPETPDSPPESNALAERGRHSREVRAVVKGFVPLRYTEGEGKLIATMLRRKGILAEEPWLQREALEAPLKRVRAPRILHLATHGFFEPDQNRPYAEGSSTTTRTQGDEMWILPPGIENPLLRSGLALAGANAFLRGQKRPEAAEDGLLTALDVCAMDLDGTELVTLSACETGIGEVQRGEGVFGLRRAFHQAGARTLVMSLWRIPDPETRILMGEFYHHLLTDMPKPEALRKAQLYLIRQMREGFLARKHRGFPHPYYWAAFICQGDPTPLSLPSGTAAESESLPHKG